MTYRPSVSVIVPAYNSAATIDACALSLLDLRYPGDLELRVVDNDSTDGTWHALRPYGHRIVVLRERTRGPGAARNAGLASATGEVVAFTDADCVVNRDWVTQLVAPLEDPAVGIAGGTILTTEPANDVQCFGEAIHDHRIAIEVYRPPYAITMSWASRAAVLRELGGFDERFLRGQDVELSYRMVQAGYRLTFVAGALVRHHNVATLPALFQKGFVHGFHGVRVRKRHESFLRRYGHRRVSPAAYTHIASSLRDWACGRDAPRAQCDAIFNLGKRAGKLLGSARFGHLDL
ncbi:MAG: glycosyltransferase [Actinomycetota bacterium]|nr:glycosyltransferase [Actinomycetota bacterium]